MKTIDDLLLHAINKEVPIINPIEKVYATYSTPDWIKEFTKGVKVGGERRHVFHTGKAGRDALDKAVEEHLKSELE